MVKGIEKLAYELSQENITDQTIGDLAEKYEEPIQRIFDALDVIKIREGFPTQLPPVPW